MKKWLIMSSSPFATMIADFRKFVNSEEFLSVRTEGLTTFAKTDNDFKNLLLQRLLKASTSGKGLNNENYSSYYSSRN